jgi:ligand-binding sensor domain-containing protein
MGLLAKQGILGYQGRVVLYQTEQAVWKLNIDEYIKRRNKLKGNYVV